MQTIPEITAVELADVKSVAARLNGSFIAGRIRTAPDDAVHDIVAPYDGAVLAQVAYAGEASVDAAVAAARAALKGEWGGLAHSDRGQLLRKLADAIEASSLQIALLESLDVGKPIQHALHDDVPTTLTVLRWYASLCDTAYDLAPTRRKGSIAQIMREPQGVVGIVLPWNYPLTTLALKIGPALAAGNTVVCKPADNTPLSTLRIAELAIEAGFPAGVINVVPGTGGVAGRALGLHNGVAAINFTGSTATGRRFLHYAAESNLKEISLECGGKNPGIILPDLVELSGVAGEIATSFMMNSGQLCSAMSRLLAPRALEDKVRSMLEDSMSKWPVGDPLNPATRIGPLVSDAHAGKVQSAIEAERGRNNDFVVSGAACNGNSDRLVAPVVFYNVEETSPTWKDEIFGPVLSVRFYDDQDEAIASANANQYGLSAYLFGGDADTIRSAASALDAGFIGVNAFTEGDMTTPFGGFKVSGFGGKDKGIHALDQYSRIKSIWWNT